MTGKAEVYLDKKLVATKSDTKSGDTDISIPAIPGERVLSVLIEAA